MKRKSFQEWVMNTATVEAVIYREDVLLALQEGRINTDAMAVVLNTDPKFLGTDMQSSDWQREILAVKQRDPTTWAIAKWGQATESGDLGQHDPKAFAVGKISGAEPKPVDASIQSFARDTADFTSREIESGKEPEAYKWIQADYKQDAEGNSQFMPRTCKTCKGKGQVTATLPLDNYNNLLDYYAKKYPKEFAQAEIRNQRLTMPCPTCRAQGVDTTGTWRWHWSAMGRTGEAVRPKAAAVMEKEKTPIKPIPDIYWVRYHEGEPVGRFHPQYWDMLDKTARKQMVNAPAGERAFGEPISRAYKDQPVKQNYGSKWDQNKQAWVPDTGTPLKVTANDPSPSLDLMLNRQYICPECGKTTSVYQDVIQLIDDPSGEGKIKRKIGADEAAGTVDKMHNPGKQIIGKEMNPFYCVKKRGSCGHEFFAWDEVKKQRPEIQTKLDKLNLVAMPRVMPVTVPFPGHQGMAASTWHTGEKYGRETGAGMHIDAGLSKGQEGQFKDKDEG